MLLGFPEDLRNMGTIAKAVSGFGILVHWHPSCTLSRVITKVYLNNEAMIPDFVKVNAGVPKRGRSWTVPVYVLKKTGVQEPPEEEAYVTAGLLHPYPPEFPRWTGPLPPARSDATPADSQTHGSNMVVDAVGVAAENEEAAVVDGTAGENLVRQEVQVRVSATATVTKEPLSSTVIPNPDVTLADDQNQAAKSSASPQAKKQKVCSVIVKDSVVVKNLFGPAPKLASVKPASVFPELGKVQNFISKPIISSPFIFLSLLDFDYNTLIPSFFCDSLMLAHLACLLPPQIREADENLVFAFSEDDEDQVEISAADLTPSKRRATKPKEQLDDRSLRRSKRNAIKLQGFKSPSAGSKATKVLNPTPLAIIPPPGSPVAPHLTKERG